MKSASVRERITEYEWSEQAHMDLLIFLVELDALKMNLSRSVPSIFGVVKNGDSSKITKNALVQPIASGPDLRDRIYLTIRICIGAFQQPIHKYRYLILLLMGKLLSEGERKKGKYIWVHLSYC